MVLHLKFDRNPGGLEEKIGPVCMQLLPNVHAMDIFLIQPCCELSLFSFKLSKFVWYF